MPNTSNNYSQLPKEGFIAADWLGPYGGLEGVSSRWQGYEADLPDRGITNLYPLRENNFGRILPHIHAARMRREEVPNGECDLTKVNLCVNALYDRTGGIDYNDPTNQFQSLISKLDDEPYNEQPELGTKLREVFDGYQVIREAQRIKAASSLSRTISKAELYVVAVDSADSQTPNFGHLYAARLSGIMNIRVGDSMKYELVVKDADGNEGCLPSTFYAPGGVSAPAAA